VDSEAEMRHQAEMKMDELERITQATQRDKQGLETDIEEWKLIAEQYRARAMKYNQAMRKILVCLEEVKPELNR
jgi:hypothetical protein